jgi:hypothetical protein
MPDAHRIAALADPNTTALSQLQSLQDAARTRGIELAIQRVDRPEEIVEAIDAAQVGGARAMKVLASPLLFCSASDYPRTNGSIAPSSDIPMAGNRPGGRARRLWPAHRPALQRCTGPTVRQASARCRSRQSAGRTTDQIRIGDQSPGREGSGSDNPAVNSGSG